MRGPGGSAELTPTEFELLPALARAEGFVTTGGLLAEVWGPAYSREQEYVRAYIRRIRAKLAGIGLADSIEADRVRLPPGPARRADRLHSAA